MGIWSVNKYLIFDSTDEHKELLKKYNDVWGGIRDKIKEVSSDASFSRWYFVWINGIKMLEYERIDISEGIDVNKTNLSNSVIFVTIGILKILVLNIRSIFAMVATI